MRRHGFTMIELIFVIVIIGILAAIALPRLAGVQDDALIASEKSGIGSSRSAVAALRGKAITRGGTDFNITVLGIDNNGDPQDVNITVDLNKDDSNDTSNTGIQISDTYYPEELSIKDDRSDAIQTNKSGKGNAMAIVLDPDGRNSYTTEANDTNSKVKGPATNAVQDPNAELNIKKHWLYNSHTGTFTIKND